MMVYLKYEYLLKIFFIPTFNYILHNVLKILNYKNYTHIFTNIVAFTVNLEYHW